LQNVVDSTQLANVIEQIIKSSWPFDLVNR
jgi:hypothetical protein